MTESNYQAKDHKRVSGPYKMTRHARNTLIGVTEAAGAPRVNLTREKPSKHIIDLRAGGPTKDAFEHESRINRYVRRQVRKNRKADRTDSY